MKYLILTLALTFMISCDDEDKTYLEYTKNIEVINKSDKNIWMSYFKNDKKISEHELTKDLIFGYGLIKD